MYTLYRGTPSIPQPKTVENRPFRGLSLVVPSHRPVVRSFDSLFHVYFFASSSGSASMPSASSLLLASSNAHVCIEVSGL